MQARQTGPASGDASANAIACAHSLEDPLVSRMTAGLAYPGMLWWPVFVFVTAKNTRKALAASVFFSGAMFLLFTHRQPVTPGNSVETQGALRSRLAVVAGLLFGGARARLLLADSATRNCNL